MRGIGEKFSPDLHTGTGNFTMPIALPPGRNGFQPQLSLVYSTGTEMGFFGLGVSLSIPGVSRKISKGIPNYDDLKDTFILSAAEDLVPIPGGPPGRTSYRPRTEGLFARIYHHSNEKNDYWEVRSKDGLTSFYGTPNFAGSQLGEEATTAPAVVADPSDTTKIFAWKLTLTKDPFGNRIEYEYEHDKGKDGPHQWDQLYLKRIRYADHIEGNETKFLISVTFVYEDRPDPFSEYRSGFEIRTRRRCRCIEIRNHLDKERLVRTYNLIYLDQRPGMEHLLPLNGVSLLSLIKVVGHDGDLSEELPPLELGYTRFEPEKRDFFPLRGMDLPAVSLANQDLELADLFGNGLPCILEMNGMVRYWRNLGGGRFDLSREMKDAPAGHRLGDQGIQLIDADGDGRIDLLVTLEGLAGYYPLRFGGLWDRRSFQRYEIAPSFNLEDPEVKLVDLDGDGVTDAIRSGSRLECFFNHPKEGWNRTIQVERRSLEVFPNINFSDPRVKWADMTGDGLQDIVLVCDGNVEYWPNLGYGRWSRRISMRNCPRFPYGYDPRRILVGDVDGDGLADIVYIDDTKVTLWINKSGNGWSEPIEIKGTPPVSDMDAVRLADMLGTGVPGVLWSKDAGELSRENYFFLDFTGGIKPYLLNEIDNHMGAITRVGYASSTQFYLKDEKRPETRWKTTLPFPVHVVKRVEVIDALSGGKLTTEYFYRHFHWDGAEGEFRGCGQAIQRDTEIFEDFHSAGLHPEDRRFEAIPVHAFSPPTETRTWFHQGPVGDEFGEWEETDFRSEFWQGDPQVLSRPGDVTAFLKSLPTRRAKRDALRTLRGHIMRTELYALDGTERQDRPYTVTEHLLGVREELEPGPEEGDKDRVFFPYAIAERTTQWERGDDPMTQFTFTDNYDEYGQACSRISVAVPKGRDFRVRANAGEPYLSTQTLTTHAKPDDAEKYIVDRVARTTTYEIVNNGSPAVFDLVQAVKNEKTATDNSLRKAVGQTLNFYDGPAFQGLSFGRVGDYGALVRTENLILTDEILSEAYKSGDAVLPAPERPPYLVPGGPSAWTAEYPQGFRDLMPPMAGYVYQADGPGSEHEKGYFSMAERRRYDFQEDATGEGRGLIKVILDPLGAANPLRRETRIEYAFDFLPIEVVDAVNLKTTAVYDYRVLQPREVIDPNGNRTAYEFTPLGLLKSIAVMGKAEKEDGDTSGQPSTCFQYDLMAFEKSPQENPQPILVHTIKRQDHRWDLVHEENDKRHTKGQPPLIEAEIEAFIPEDEVNKYPERFIQSREYSDGFGRLLQTRTQAEDVFFGDPDFGNQVLPADQKDPGGDAKGQHADPMNPRVVVSGWQVYDNKGQVVEKYEPFFSKGWDYALPGDTLLKKSQKAVMFYDPRGHVVRTVNTDGSEQRVIYGTPLDMDDPDAYMPTPWEAYTYDANDNAGRTHPGASAGYKHHWNTPSSALVDALGRTVETTERNGQNTADWYVTHSTYDIRGNLLTVRDPLGRIAFRYTYDLTPKSEDEKKGSNVLRIEQIDAGTRRTIFDAAGSELERRDSKGAAVFYAYDMLDRPIRLWARDDASGSLTLRERLEYGDGSDPWQPEAERQAKRLANMLGKLHRHYDEAGLLAFETYDFKGNILEKSRQVISDDQILSVFGPAAANNWKVEAYRIDWSAPAGTDFDKHALKMLSSTAYEISFLYDALNRIKIMRYPQDVDGERKLLRPMYNRAGGLESIELDDKAYAEHIAYNAKGQRTLIAYGNGIMTRYAYDPQTFRLVRMLSEHFASPEALVYHPAGKALQDFAYEYDLAGNITVIHDRSWDSGILGVPPGKDALDRNFTYDPIYRLLTATGRECDLPRSPYPWGDSPRCANESGSVDFTRARGYREEYEYDRVGNMLKMMHSSSDEGFTRIFSLKSKSNRLESLATNNGVCSYLYDASGNMTQETKRRHFEWDHRDHMRVYRTQIGYEEPSVYAHYLYDSSGQRVKKLVRKNGDRLEVTVCIDNVFECHQRCQADASRENNTLHLMDNEKRIALIRIGNPFPDDTTLAVKYHLGDHLGSSNAVVDDSGIWVNREEYTPYGETSFGSFARKRYRFTGKERDEESGLYYHGARYYALWLGRWTSCDPAGFSGSVNTYLYTWCNPLRATDPCGMQSRETQYSAPIEEMWRQSFPQTHATSSEIEEMWLQSLPKTDNISSVPTTITQCASNENIGSQPKGGNLKLPATAAKVAKAGIKLWHRNSFMNYIEDAITKIGSTAANFLSRGRRILGSLPISDELATYGSHGTTFLGASITNRPKAANPAKIAKSLNVIAAFFSAVFQYTQSPAQTEAGKALDAALAGGSSYVVGKKFPITAAVDAVSGGSLSGYIKAFLTTSIVATEEIIIGNANGLDLLWEQEKEGNYGLLVKLQSLHSERTYRMLNQLSREGASPIVIGAYYWANSASKGLFR